MKYGQSASGIGQSVLRERERERREDGQCLHWLECECKVIQVTLYTGRSLFVAEVSGPLVSPVCLCVCMYTTSLSLCVCAVFLLSLVIQ